MKRSKLFLGITSCLLAVAGIAAAKMHFQSIQPYYYTVTNSAFCSLSSTPIAADIVPDGGQQLTITVPGGQPGVYFTSTCKLPLYHGN